MSYLSNKSGKCSGFTLMEVMVAIAVMGITLIGLMHIFSSLLSGIGKTELYAEGTLVAREVLERSLIGKNLEEGIYTGEVKQMFLWELVVTQRETALDFERGLIELEESSTAALPINWLEENSPLKMYELSVTVKWPDTPYPGSVNLTTLRAIVNPEVEIME